MEFPTMEERLIELVKNQPCLYDRKHPLYKNNIVRDQKFEQFSRILNIPAKKLKDRWRTLRDKFYKETKTPPCGSFVSVKKKWKWMDHLIFLKDIDRSSSRTIKTQNQSETEEDEDCASTTTSFQKVEFPMDYNFEECIDDVDHTEKQNTRTNDIKSELSDSITLSKEMLYSQPAVVQKTSQQLFFECLAKQTEDAKLSAQEFANLQIELLKTFNRIVHNM